MTKKPDKQEEEESPKGTMTLLIIFLALTLAGWFGVYMLLINRGG
jgi:hypothetical protein